MKKYDGGPAFPMMTGGQYFKDHSAVFENVEGASLRDYFVATVDPKIDVSADFMEQVLGRKRPGFQSDPRGYLEYCAEFEALIRGIFADAMLAERLKPIEGTGDDV